MGTNLFDAEGITRSERTLHTPSGFAKRHLAYLQELGKLQSLKSHSSIRENLESYLMFFVMNGEGDVVYQNKTYSVKQGDLVFLDCRNHYEHKSSEEHPWELLWVHFNGRLPEACYPMFYEKNGQSPVLCPETGLQPYREIVDRLKERQKNRTILSEMETSHELSMLMLLCMREVAGDEDAIDDEEEGGLGREDYEGVREYINEHFGDAGLKSALAIQYGTEPGKLNEAFEKKYGITIEAYIDNRKFNKAKELLRFTIKPIADVIVESGIGEEDEFRRLFMENEEMTPEEYRRKWAQWIKG